jgi:hypothetical protein
MRVNPDEDSDGHTAPEASPVRRTRTLISTRFLWLVAFLLVTLGILQFGHWTPPEHPRDELSVNNTSPIEKETQQPESMHGKLNVA